MKSAVNRPPIQRANVVASPFVNRRSSSPRPPPVNGFRSVSTPKRIHPYGPTSVGRASLTSMTNRFRSGLIVTCVMSGASPASPTASAYVVAAARFARADGTASTAAPAIAANLQADRVDAPYGPGVAHATHARPTADPPGRNVTGRVESPRCTQQVRRLFRHTSLAGLQTRLLRRGALPSGESKVAQWIEQRFPTPLRLFDSGSAIRPAQVLFSKQRTTPEIRGKSVLFLKPLKGALVLRLSRGEESP